MEKRKTKQVSSSALLSGEGGLTTYQLIRLCSQETVPEMLTFLLSLLKIPAIQIDKVNLQIYCAWSLLDNFEWNDGYRVRFGLYHVDFEDPARPRVPYKSAKEYAKVIRNNGLEEKP